MHDQCYRCNFQRREGHGATVGGRVGVAARHDGGNDDLTTKVVLKHLDPCLSMSSAMEAARTLLPMAMLKKPTSSPHRLGAFTVRGNSTQKECSRQIFVAMIKKMLGNASGTDARVVVATFIMSAKTLARFPPEIMDDEVHHERLRR